jgi:AAA15 family ATPase/GTPase
LKEFQTNSVKQINLIAGKNNTGKSSILEAVAIYACKGKMNDVISLLDNRGEYSVNQTVADYTETNVNSLSRLFSGKAVEYHRDSAIQTGAINDFVSLRFVKYIYNAQNQASEKILLDNENDSNAKTGFEISYKDTFLIQLNMPVNRFENLIVPEKYQIVGASDIHGEMNGKLFDNITLTEKESHVIEALRIIEPRMERIAFITDKSSQTRNAVMKLSGMRDVSPLRSMGDGVNRILTIILAMVNVENGYLLIDEFENGLHYSVQEQLWKIIFRTAKTLNVQVFATTHSNDCIRSFGNILNSGDYDSTIGKLIRLDKKNDIVFDTDFNAEELHTANVQNIEIR